MPNPIAWEYAKLEWSAHDIATFTGPDGAPQDVSGKSDTLLLTELGESSWELVAIDHQPGGEIVYMFKRAYGTA